MRESQHVGQKTPSTVIVGLSSGVDSSVAAWLLKQQGYRVIAVTLALAEPLHHDTTRSCCSPALMTRTKAIADHLRIPHYAVDERGEFRSQVIDYFVAEYEVGRTPNPCAKCNARVRFAALLAMAQRLGADNVATGHYARLTGAERRLARAADRAKDQSYVLAEVDPSVLARCMFPLGDLTKQVVRGVSAEIGLSELVSEESQDLCFVSRGAYREFLREKLGEAPGEVVDGEGNAIGSHSGTYNYTVGQRRGLGQGGSDTLYVASVDAERREVLAVRRDRAGVRLIRFAVAAKHREPPRGVVTVQFRSMGAPVRARLLDGWTVLLEESALGVAPGQTVVVYDGDEVVAGGTILATSANVEAESLGTAEGR